MTEYSDCQHPIPGSYTNNEFTCLMIYKQMIMPLLDYINFVKGLRNKRGYMSTEDYF